MSTHTSPDHESAVRRLSDSDAFNLLSDQRRRVVIDVLERDGPTQISELADRVSDRIGSSTDSARISLAHCHLPKLQDYGVIERSGQTIRLGPVAPELRRHWMDERRPRE